MALSIPDYFARVRPTQARGTADNPFGASATQRTFAKLLSRAMDEDPDEKSGLTIADYLSRPVTLSPLFASGARQGGSLTDPSVKNADPVSGDSPGAAPPSAVAMERGASPAPLQTAVTSDPRAAIDQEIQTASRKYSLSSRLLRAVIRAESNFDPEAVSPAGAQGLMQLMPGTAKELGVSDPFDIEQNIDGGARYLRQMLDRFGGDLKSALAAYNAGPGTVERYQGKVPYPETVQYVRRVMTFARNLA